MTLPRPMLAAGTDTHSRWRIAAARTRVLFGKSLWHALEIVKLGEKTRRTRDKYLRDLVPKST